MKDCLERKTGTLVCEMDGAYVVWMASCNQYLRLEEPAYFVFTSYEKYGNLELAVSQCAGRYSIPEDECRQFVTEILDGVEAIEQAAMLRNYSLPDDEGLREKTFTPFSVRHYSINGKLLCFHFGTRLYEHYLHPLLQHLETETSLPHTPVFEIFGHNNRVILRANQQIKGIWGEDETHRLKGMAFLQILNTVYEKEDDDWMAIIHASAVTNGTKTIVFAARPGSGKSTIAALLQQKGFALVSDDFVPLERHTQQAFPFPAAMSVKEGATALLSAWYPWLYGQGELQQSITHKPVRYLPVEGKTVPAQVKEIIFIKYDAASDFEMEQLSGTEALKMLLDETWTSPLPENAARFLNWYPSVSCYRLTYSNNEKALQSIINLFEHD